MGMGVSEIYSKEMWDGFCFFFVEKGKRGKGGGRGEKQEKEKETLTKRFIAELPRDVRAAGTSKQARELLLRKAVLVVPLAELGQAGDLAVPPLVAVLARAKQAVVVVVVAAAAVAAHGGVVEAAVDAGGLEAALEGARLLVARDVVLAVGAVGADVALDQVLADLLADLDALAVEPVLAPVARDHPAVVVWPTADTIGAVVRLLVAV